MLLLPNRWHHNWLKTCAVHQSTENSYWHKQKVHHVAQVGGLALQETSKKASSFCLKVRVTSFRKAAMSNPPSPFIATADSGKGSFKGRNLKLLAAAYSAESVSAAHAPPSQLKVLADASTLKQKQVNPPTAFVYNIQSYLRLLCSSLKPEGEAESSCAVRTHNPVNQNPRSRKLFSAEFSIVNSP